jgi:hypothetical protein
MDRFAPRNKRSRQVPLDLIFTASADYRYFALRLMALNEERERVVSEIACARLLTPPEPMTRHHPRPETVGHPLRDLLIRVGTRLQGAECIPRTTAPAPDPEPATG